MRNLQAFFRLHRGQVDASLIRPHNTIAFVISGIFFRS
jgi:hypothetical protein